MAKTKEEIVGQIPTEQKQPETQQLTDEPKDVRIQQLSHVIRPKVAELARKVTMAVLQGEVRAGDFATAMETGLEKYVTAGANDIAQELIDTLPRLKF